MQLKNLAKEEMKETLLSQVAHQRWWWWCCGEARGSEKSKGRLPIYQSSSSLLPIFQGLFSSRNLQTWASLPPPSPPFLLGICLFFTQHFNSMQHFNSEHFGSPPFNDANISSLFWSFNLKVKNSLWLGIFFLLNVLKFRKMFFF